MKIPVVDEVTINTEVEVTFTDICNAFGHEIERAAEDGKRSRTCLQILDHLTKLLALVPDETLANFQQHHRDELAKRLTTELQRLSDCSPQPIELSAGS